MTFSPKRGDLVSFAGQTFYFQPGGNACFLYLKKEDVGHTSRAVLVPRRSAISKPVPGSFPRGGEPLPPTPIRYDPTSIDELMKQMDALTIK